MTLANAGDRGGGGIGGEAVRQVLDGLQADLWLLSPGDLSPAQRQACLGLVGSEERSRLARLRRTGDREQHAAAHGLLRVALSLYHGVRPDQWEFARLPGGRPVIAAPLREPRLSFNLSHTAGLVACVIATQQDCGVDVEKIEAETDLASLAAQCLSEREAAEWRRLPPGAQVERFFEYWTLKEACLKALGRGLSLPLTALSFEIGASGEVALSGEPLTGGKGSSWRFCLDCPTPRHKLAAAVRVEEGWPLGITCRWMTPEALAAIAGQ
jgi:4'-phosphopantetheinyl transferase